MEKDQLGHAPGRLAAIDRHGEVGEHGRLAGLVDKAVIGQPVCPGSVQKHAGVFQGGKILAVDPDQVDGAALVPPGGLFRQDLGNDIGGVGHLDVDDIDTIALLHGAAGPGDVIVDARLAAPGVEIDGLAARLVHNGVPVFRIRGLPGSRRKCGEED